MKIKGDLKKGVNKSSYEIGKTANTKKNEQPKVAGFKNIKEMIEQNIKKQRVMSTGVLRPDKKKNPGKKYGRREKSNGNRFHKNEKD